MEIICGERNHKMAKYEEEHYKYENIKDKIYPWIKGELTDSKALNGKMLSEKKTTVITFVGDLKIILAIKRENETYEIIQDNMLATDTDVLEVYHTACENLVRDVEFVIGNTFYGAYGIIADGIHEVSSLCFKHIWEVCVDKLKDDLLIMAPEKDTLLFAPASQKKVVEEMIDHGRKAYDAGTDRVSNMIFRYSKEEGELTVYGA